MAAVTARHASKSVPFPAPTASILTVPFGLFSQTVELGTQNTSFGIRTEGPSATGYRLVNPYLSSLHPWFLQLQQNTRKARALFAFITGVDIQETHNVSSNISVDKLKMHKARIVLMLLPKAKGRNAKESRPWSLTGCTEVRFRGCGMVQQVKAFAVCKHKDVCSIPVTCSRRDSDLPNCSLTSAHPTALASPTHTHTQTIS